MSQPSAFRKIDLERQISSPNNFAYNYVKYTNMGAARLAVGLSLLAIVHYVLIEGLPRSSGEEVKLDQGLYGKFVEMLTSLGWKIPILQNAMATYSVLVATGELNIVIFIGSFLFTLIVLSWALS